MLNVWRILFLASFALSVFACSRGTSSNAPRSHADTSDAPAHSSEPNEGVVNKPSGTVEVPTEGSIADRAARRNDLGKRNTDTTTTGRPAALRFEPAAENSEAATAMQDDGSVLEVRVFRNHAQLARAEARWSATGPKSLKIRFKNGRVVTVQTDRLANLKTAPTSLLVELATAK